MSSDKSKIRLGGLKLGHRFSFLRIPGDLPFGFSARLFKQLAQQRINLSFLTTTGLTGQGQLAFCVDIDDLTKTLAIIESDPLFNRPYDLVGDVSLLSLYPTKSRLDFLGLSLLAFGQQQVSLLAASSSISALTFVLDHNQIPGAIEALTPYFELPNRSSWLEESKRIKQIDAIKPD